MTLVARNFGNTFSLFGDTVLLRSDGEEVYTDHPCTLLPGEFRDLYMESSTFSLTKNLHTLSLVNARPDYSYLPSAFLFGDFALAENNRLRKLPETVSIGSFRNQGLLNYAGGIIFKKKVALHGQEYLSVDTGGLVCELFVGGQSLGRKAWAPFLWEIPKKYTNKTVELKILVTTSVRPLFGELKK